MVAAQEEQAIEETKFKELLNKGCGKRIAVIAADGNFWRQVKWRVTKVFIRVLI